MTLPPMPALLAVLFCAALFVLLFQYLFPRPALWSLAATAIGAGIICTFLLSLALRHFVAPGLSGFETLTSAATALPFAILRAGLPEEGVKGLAAIIALLPFWRRVTPAQAFQAALFVAVGFAVVENQGYAMVFGDYAILIALGRGFLATLTHTLLAMIFGGFLMRFAARGWRHWHLPIIGYLVAAGCHALYDAGLLPPLAEYLRTRTVSIPTMLAALPVVAGGIALVLIAGLWSLRSAIRRAAADDPIAAELSHKAIVRRWRWAANIVLVLGIAGLIAAIVWVIFVEAPQPETPPGTPDVQNALVGTVSLAGSVFAIIASWVLRQKR
jgi:RsiW-degrading membrane proteinase PrsW (M82 family)